MAHIKIKKNLKKDSSIVKKQGNPKLYFSIKLNLSDPVIHTYIYFRLFSIIGFYKILNIAPYAIQ